jgi:RES domain-containing protein
LILWRAARRRYADLLGKGGLHHSGRWHLEGRPVVYTAERPALALLEVGVNLDLPKELALDDYVTMKILVPDGLQILDASSVNPDHKGAARSRGDKWLSESKSALLKVPSAAATESANFLINPLRKDAAGISIGSITAFAFDSRLFG